jgi:hypothetical protein
MKFKKCTFLSPATISNAVVFGLKYTDRYILIQNFLLLFSPDYYTINYILYCFQNSIQVGRIFGAL